MLILTRRPGESVMIGDEVTVTVLGVTPTHVRLGFAAPKEVAVHREEIYERMHRGPIATPVGVTVAESAKSDGTMRARYMSAAQHP